MVKSLAAPYIPYIFFQTKVTLKRASIFSMIKRDFFSVRGIYNVYNFLERRR